MVGIGWGGKEERGSRGKGVRARNGVEGKEWGVAWAVRARTGQEGRKEEGVGEGGVGKR